MKQPELGKKITELRKAKGLTQEELVEKCNISVRTIQRIETGEVTPRSYTVKSILSALESDLEELEVHPSSFFDSVGKSIKNLFLIDIDIHKPSSYLFQQLNLSWIVGVIHFIARFFEGPAEYFRYENDELLYGETGYVLLKLVVLVSYLFFMRGIILLGGLFRNYLLQIITIVLIAASSLMIVLDIFTVYFDVIEPETMMVGASLTFGSIGIVFGVALNKLKNHLGTIAKFAGVFQVIAAALLLSIVLSIAGFVVLVPGELFLIILIFKANAVLKSKEILKQD